MTKTTTRGNPNFLVNCVAQSDKFNSLKITIPKRQIVDYYHLRDGDIIVLKFIKKISTKDGEKDVIADED